MSARWLHEWFPCVAMLLQTTLWGLLAPHLLGSHYLACLTFTDPPEDEDW